jgi:hypothetical protein
LVRSYDHLLGESWCIEDAGAILGMFFGSSAKERAEKQLQVIRHRPAPFTRSLEARAKLLEHLRGLDNRARSLRAKQRSDCRRRRRDRE